ncbi:two component receiver domain protein (probably degenerated) [Pseudorhizobium banfieldiae]|uniref:Two component receiver domain protein (Probably degenerated) n=1 Tax=Pseudorhizobium banfieldiae TaxID=1125847 RepID=L0NB53_9HYPH|nr:response regulator [Pseudorhizobium banfieldiae]CCF18318.1 two component receiver domain protein (probably degenerated) [Pseudorhizobium banfieldiae]
MATASMLEELEYDFSKAGSVEEALPILEREEVDIVVTDLGLPGMSGEDCCRDVRRRWPQIGLVLATGAAPGLVLEDASRTALLTKRHGVEQLRAALKAVLNH